MKIVLEVPENKAAFVLELLENLSFIEARPEVDEAASGTTDYLLSSPANRDRLMAALERYNRGEVEHHELLEE